MAAAGPGSVYLRGPAAEAAASDADRVGRGAPDVPSRGWMLFSGILGTIAGLILLVWPAISILTLAILAGVWLIVIGFMQISVAVQLRRI
jgi:uncharacterized membrane protein HdeD (DUF308 family)